MGISTVASYTGAQLFQVIGLSQELVDEYFTGLPAASAASASTRSPPTSPAGTESLTRPTRRSARTANSRSVASTSGVARASTTCSTRTPCSSCSTRPAPGSTTLQGVHKLVDDQSERLASLRGLFSFKTEERKSISIDEVEPATEIVKRFSTGAMSYGSISRRGARDARDSDEPSRRRGPIRVRAAKTRAVRRRRERRLAP